MGRVIYNGIYTKYLNLNLNRRRSMAGLSITKILLKDKLTKFYLQENHVLNPNTIKLIESYFGIGVPCTLVGQW